MKKMKKLFLTCSVTLVLFIASSVSVFADPPGVGVVEPNSINSPSTVIIEQVSSPSSKFSKTASVRTSQIR